MKCSKCKKDSLISGFCKEHFIAYFENTVKNTIKKFNLFKKNDKIIVGVSGGKDSLTTLHVLKKLGYNVSGLAIDEGIKGYRADTLKDLKRFCKEYNIKFKVVSFKKEFGLTLDNASKKTKDNPCHTCGVLRRYLLNKYSKGYNVLATGHNLDDEAQAVLMNIFKAQTEISARAGPVAGIKKSESMTRRVKPLYFLKEKEVKAYTLLKGFKIHFKECPYVHSSFRGKVSDELNEYEKNHPNTKVNLINSFIKNLPRLKKKYKESGELIVCKICGAESSNEHCNTCILLKKLRS